MSRISLIFILIVSCLPAMAAETGVSSAANGRYEEATRRYANGDWAGAESKLAEIPPAEWSVQSLLLLGHAQARQEKDGKVAEAMLSYRRVLDLRPGQPEASQNLLVLARSQGVVEPPAPSPIDGFLLSISVEAFVLAASVAAWLAIAGGMGLFLQCKGGLAILSIISLSTGTLALGTTGTAWMVKERAVKASPDSPPRVWLADGQLMKDSPLYSEPTRSTERIVESVPSGTSLRVVRKSGWSYVEVPRGGQEPPLRGWIQNSSWLPLRPGDHGSGPAL
ncbi:MAG: hypothetical protein ACKO2G_02230 [Verrucomicrobiales bacterium]